jgi:hypothetical protein
VVFKVLLQPYRMSMCAEGGVQHSSLISCRCQELTHPRPGAGISSSILELANFYQARVSMYASSDMHDRLQGRFQVFIGKIETAEGIQVGYDPAGGAMMPDFGTIRGLLGRLYHPFRALTKVFQAQPRLHWLILASPRSHSTTVRAKQSP